MVPVDEERRQRGSGGSTRVCAGACTVMSFTTPVYCRNRHDCADPCGDDCDEDRFRLFIAIGRRHEGLDLAVTDPQLGYD